MNNKRSPVEQMILFALLAFSAYMLSQQFFGPKNPGGARPEKVVPPLAQAFKGLQNEQAPLSKDAALKEIATLQSEVTANGQDEYSYWARLRAGLLQQYVLKNPVEARKFYDEVVNRHKTELVDAQAIYQSGDLALREADSKNFNPNQSTAPTSAGNTVAGNSVSGNAVTAGNSATPDVAQSPAALEQAQGVLRQQGAQTLEYFLTRSRGHKIFLDQKIFVPDVKSARGDPLQIPTKWEELPLTQLMGKGSTLPANTGSAPDPRLILTRVDSYYSSTPLYKIFDAVVNWFGAQPSYSYGLALIVLALVTRLVMQPLIKKQYDGMKGMQIIAPEMKKIQDKYKGKTDQESQMRMMKEIRELQKNHGVNPMGCGLSLIVQMPVFFFIVLPLINHYQARMELADAHFGWVHSLAHPDIPLLILYAISMFISVRLSSTPPADAQQAQMQKMTTIMSPLFALFLWSYPSAFILYWFTYNSLSTVLQWRMMKASEPDKDLVKTLMGTGAAPAPALSTASGEKVIEAESSSSAIPPRPSGKKNGGNKNSSVRTTKLPEGSRLPEAAVSQNGVSKNGVAKNGSSAKNVALESNVSPFEPTSEGGSSQSTPDEDDNGSSANGSTESSGAARRRRRRR